ncbi:MAG: HD domain-containing protein [Candidatus Taylorbacteria bacterium]|nr:HD domain-containing protein [Candidatus Taylorbacteria bacterium]
MEINLFGRKENIPKEVSRVTETLEKAGFEAYLVGGCVRDLLLKKEPKDWDVTTNATPDQILSLFGEDGFYENTFGTVGVVNRETENERLKVVEVTPYRLESVYSDHRRPDSVKFSQSLEEDLKRRDFTINALALRVKDKETEVVDLYGGKKDIADKVIRTVGNPDERFTEDALRILRAIRFTAELGFALNIDTANSIKKNVNLLGEISKERIRDEFIKIIMSDKPMDGLITAHTFGVLKYIAPELELGIGVEQKGTHVYDVWEHLLRSVQHSADRKWPLEVRLSALFHDVGKPETRRFSRETDKYTFYGHEVVGSRVTKKILERLRFPVKTIEKVTKLARWHMFFSDTEQITLSAVRRMIANVGKENIWDLMNVRASDRIGTGRPKENPYRLRKYQSMIEEAMRDPISVGMLKTDGKRLMEVTRETPGPRLGYILHALLEDVLDDPKLNTEEYLDKKALELSKKTDTELKKLGEEGKLKKEEEDDAKVTEIRGKFNVK